ncbi:hypothetical protein [Calothrix sp. PCC 6303]|uniref:hypothetical protein n=1 Tax=Calothrix sp. PCC 6303 TaxID=1170562 RepID=UPI0002A04E15|nr:hypothetical protein [Calothrix sp. PCC 6303]AFZ00285.1 hypothetical protein Cal6303_1224 [Calothrix sp. PCC 6303]
MNHIFDTPKMAERLESLKAGIISSVASVFGFLLTNIINTWLLHLQPFSWTSSIFIGFSGFLFGVTYRYIIRNDDNPHLKSGGVMAFGLVRGLAQIDGSLKNIDISTIALPTESILCFAIAATILDFSIQQNWIQPFLGND